MRKLTEAECAAAIQKGDFDSSVTGAAKNVAVILTQSWCPQWKAMRGYIENVEKETGAAVFFVEYDIEKWQNLANEDFMSFKEDAFKNREIPYVRLYGDGKFRRDFNYVSADAFKDRLKDNKL